MSFPEELHTARKSCFIGRTSGAKNLATKVECVRGQDNPEWKAAAEKFWAAPPEEWYQTLKYLRKVVVETKF